MQLERKLVGRRKRRERAARIVPPIARITNQAKRRHALLGRRARRLHQRRNGGLSTSKILLPHQHARHAKRAVTFAGSPRSAVAACAFAPARSCRASSACAKPAWEATSFGAKASARL